MVNILANLLVSFLYNDTANSSDCLVWNGWLLSDELGRKKL